MTTHWLITPQYVPESGAMLMWCGLRTDDARGLGDRVSTVPSVVDCARCLRHAEAAYYRLHAAFGGETR